VTVAKGSAKAQSKSVTVSTPSTWKSVKVTVSQTAASKKIAKITVSKKKVTVKAVKKGSTKVTVKVTGKKSGKKVSKSLKLTAKVVNASVKASAVSIKVNGTASIGAKKCPAAATLSYVSSDTTVATVSESGVVTGVKVGTATITVTSNYGPSTTAVVTVTDGDADVKSVEALNARQIKVTFNTPVYSAFDATQSAGSEGSGALDAANYTLSTNKNLTDADIEKVSDTEFILTYSSGTVEATTGTFTVKGIPTLANTSKNTAVYSKAWTYTDSVAPTVTKISAVTNGAKFSKFKLEFSEPVASISGLQIDGSAVATDTTLTGIDDTSLEVTFTTGKEMSASGTKTVKVIGLTDCATQNKTTAQPNVNEVQTLSLSVTVDTTAPVISSLTAKGDNAILLTFSEPVDKTKVLSNAAEADHGTVKLYKSVASQTEESSAKTSGYDFNISLANASDAAKDYVSEYVINLSAPGYTASSTSYNYLVQMVADKVKDEAGNGNTAYEGNVTLTMDTTAPKLLSMSALKDSDGLVYQIIVTADKEVAVLASSSYGTGKKSPVIITDAYSQLEDGKYSYTDKNGKVQTVALPTPAVGADKKTFVYTFDSGKRPSWTGTYSFSFPKGYITDTAAGKNSTPNDCAAADLKCDFGTTDTSAITATVDNGVGNNVFTVKFTDASGNPVEMTQASLTSDSNYKLDDNALPTHRFALSAVSGVKNSMVTITIVDGTISKDNKSSILSVSGVVSTNGVTVTSTQQKVVTTDTVAPTIASAKMSGGSVLIKFSEDIRAKDDTNDKLAQYLLSALRYAGSDKALSTDDSNATIVAGTGNNAGYYVLSSTTLNAFTSGKTLAVVDSSDVVDDTTNKNSLKESSVTIDPE
jgi:hypothetical protein